MPVAEMVLEEFHTAVYYNKVCAIWMLHLASTLINAVCVARNVQYLYNT